MGNDRFDRTRPDRHAERVPRQTAEERSSYAAAARAPSSCNEKRVTDCTFGEAGNRAKKQLRLLLIEDSEDDAMLLLKDLERRGYEVVAERVCDSEGMTMALEGGGWDAIVSDYHLPGFGVLEALRLLEARGLDLPFVVVSGKVGEENAVEVMRAGAHDYVAKDKLARLGPAIERELRQAEVRRAKGRAEDALVKSEGRFRSTFEQAAVGVAHVGLTGEWLRANKKLCGIVGYAEEELLGMTFQDITHPDDLDADLDHLDRLTVGEIGTYSAEKRCLRKDGSIVWVNLTVSLAREGFAQGTPGYLISVIEDITKRKQAEEALRQSEERYRAAVEQAAECIFLVDMDTKHVLESNPAFQDLLGYTAEELLEKNLHDFVAHDRASIDQNIQRILEKGSLSLGERRYRRKDALLLDVEVSASVLRHGGRRALCIVAHDITERKWTEESLRRNLDVLLALREAGQILSSTLESEKVATKLLEIMRSVSGLVAAVINVQDDRGQFRIWRASGLDGLWRRARYTPEAEAARRAVLETGERHLFRLPRPGSETEHLAGLCLPLRMQNRITGVLEAYGPKDLTENDAVDILSSLTVQAASALENARNYGELAEREKRLEELVGKLITAQEEERRRVAYEVHDGLAQLAVAAHQRLQAFALRHPSTSEKGVKDLDRILVLVRQTVSEARRVIANLRPTALDDFGLGSAIRIEVEELRGNGWRIDYEEDLGDERLPAAVETALFRVTQEALTNARKHARTARARLGLWRREGVVNLEIQDWGRGFDPGVLYDGRGPGERVGLSGMRERVGMIGGELKVRSRRGEGTLISARVPLPKSGRTGQEGPLGHGGSPSNSQSDEARRRDEVRARER